MCKMFCILFWTVACCLSTGAAQTYQESTTPTSRSRYFIGMPDLILHGQGYRNLTVTSATRCSASCLRDTGCFSINYSKWNKLCELNGAAASQFPQDLTYRTGSYYYGLEEVCVIKQLQLLVSEKRECSVDLEVPLGMENGNIPDESITMSSYFDSTHVKARLNARGFPASWSALSRDSDPWIEVDFNKDVLTTGLITQGRDGGDNTNQWVTTYKVSFLSESQLMCFVRDGDGSPTKFKGNVDEDTQVTVRFRLMLNTRAIRIHPTGWNRHCSMRFEVIGCFI